MTAIGNGHLLAFGAAFLVSLVLSPVFGKISTAIGLIDHPSARRFHLTSMPLMGGMAVTAAFLFVYLAAVKGIPPMQFVGVLAASVFLMTLGLIDDIKNISPAVKLLGQFIAGALLILSGLHVSMTGVTAIDYALTLVWVAGVVNCQNLLDNIDGLAGGAAAIAGCFFFIAAAITGRPDVAIAAAVFSGACVGFLFHNFHPATIFSGDAGSMFMGCMLASFGLFFMKPDSAVSHMFPGVILGLLIFDTGLVTIMRKLHGRKIADGGKDHASHRLCYMGLSIQTSVITLFIVSFLFGAAGIIMILLKPQAAILIPIVLFAIAALCWYLMRNLYDYEIRAV